MDRIKKILIANRGEIAARIMRTCRKLNMVSGGVFADDDRKSLHVRTADEVFSLGNGPLHDTYLNVDKLIAIARKNKYDAIHPGYGFLSENPLFSKACAANNILFIGPEASVIELMGDKIASKKLAIEAGVPVLTPFTGTADVLMDQIDQYDFPVLVKAAAGGGGKGMRIVDDPKKLKDALHSTSREARSYFNDERIFVEKYIRDPRHIEVQVLADHHGNSVTLFERECTLQRRHQKVIEEAPSPTLDPEKRKQILDAALKIVEKANYTNAGTIEFLVEENLNFYFLEMNTRIQVEHPVTEAITGIDMVEEQIRIAGGEKLRISSDSLRINGHAVECRIYAEDPSNNFYPSPGTIFFYEEPVRKGVRIDASIDGPAEISGNYDPMVAKVIAHGKDRSEAISMMEDALTHYYIHGIKTNLEFQRQLIKHRSYVENKISTEFIDQHLEKLLKAENSEPSHHLLVAFSIFYDLRCDPKNVWEEIGFWRVYSELTFVVDGERKTCRIEKISEREIRLSCDDKIKQYSLIVLEKHHIRLQSELQVYQATISRDDLNRYLIGYGGKVYYLDRDDNLMSYSFEKDNASGRQHDDVLSSPMPGKILEINVREGEKVERDQKLIVLEAMKMENLILAPFEGIVEKIWVDTNEVVDAGRSLVKLSPNSS